MKTRLRASYSRSLVAACGLFMLLVSGSGLGTGKVAAQDKPAGGLEIAEVDGVLEAVAGDRLKIKGQDEAEYFVLPLPQTNFAYTGTATAKFLRPGFMVRFLANFDLQNGIAIKPVSELEVFRPAKQRRMTPEQRLSETPGVYPVLAKDEDQKKEKPRGDARQKNRTPPAAGAAGARPSPPNANQTVTSQEFKVVGKLAVVTANRIRILAGPRPVLVDLDAQTKITVAAGDAVFCMPGDQVHVSGLRNAAQASLIQAETVEIAGHKPLGAEPGTADPKNAKDSGQNLDSDTPKEQKPTKRGKLGK